jgi:hypothetical protein
VTISVDWGKSGNPCRPKRKNVLQRHIDPFLPLADRKLGEPRLRVDTFEDVAGILMPEIKGVLISLGSALAKPL